MSAPHDTMTVIEVEGGSGGPEALKPARAPIPRPESGQVLVRVRAAGVNRPDLLQRRGLYPPPPGAPKTLGLEVAGEVAALGPGVSRWREGDQVCALLGGGGYAEYALVDARHALPIPAGLSLVEAGGVPETVFTVFTNVFEIGQLKAGETFMVHGATSGIGVAAIQMAKAAGAKVIATGRGADKAAKALALGADVAVDTRTQDFTAAALAGGGVDVVLDMVGGDFAQKNIDALKPGGRLVFIAFQAGARAELDLAKIMMKRLTVTGSTLRPRSAEEKARLAERVEAVAWPWLADGRLKVVVDKTFPLAEAAAAHAYLEAGAHVGKVILTA